MKIKDNIESNQYRKETILVTDCFYTTTEQGAAGKRPLVHVCGSTWTGQRRHVVVDGFRPYFFISREEYEQRHEEIHTQVERHDSKIIGVDNGDHTGLVVGGTVPIVKIICQYPFHVADVRDWFDQTWEADVLFSQRFLIDRNITGACTIPADVDADTRLSPDDIKPVDETTIEPTILTFDIEVFVGEQGFPNYSKPDQLVTAITGHDSSTDQYWTGILEHPSWGDKPLVQRSITNAYDDYDFVALDDVDGDVTIYDRDDRLLYEFIEWAIDVAPDLITAWNIEFDIPYTINRALDVGCGNIDRLSPVERVDEVESDWDTQRSITGVQVVDAINMYKKTQIHGLKSKALENVAQKELGVGKEEIEGTDEAWVHEPVKFTQYNIRDVQATVEILQQSGAIELYNNIRKLTGTPWEQMNDNSNIIDPIMLHIGQGEFQ